jgi:hypothetical protein
MKRTLFIIATLFLAAGLRAQPLPQMAHPAVDVHHLEFDRDEFRVEPVRVEPINFDSARSSFNEDRREPEHLDFGSRNLAELDNMSDSFEQERNNHNNEFSNMRMQFEDPKMEHLNFNVQ